MEKMACLLCGDPSAVVKTSKRGQPYLRCENCESILFTYSALGAELLEAGGVPSKANPAAQYSGHGSPPVEGLVVEVKALKKAVADLVKAGGNPRPAGRLTRRQFEEGRT